MGNKNILTRLLHKTKISFIASCLILALATIQSMRAAVDHTAILTGDINATATWGLATPATVDALVWSTGNLIIKQATTPITFNGGTLLVATNGTLYQLAATGVLNLNNLILDGGIIQAAVNNTLNLQNKTFTLNSGSMKTVSSGATNRNILFQNCSLEGNGTITLAQLNAGAFENFIEFQSTVSTKGFTGKFVVAPGLATGTAPSIVNGAGGELKLNAIATGSFGVSVPAADAALGVTSNSTAGAYKSTIPGKLYFTPGVGNTVTLVSLSLGGVNVAPGTYGLVAETGITAFTATQLVYLNSASTGTVTITGVVNAPTAVVATVGNQSASVAFAPPINTAGYAITGYTVTPYDVTTSTTGTPESGATSPISVTGLTNGHNYTFTVTASNQFVTSSSSTTSNQVTPIVVPNAPTNIVVTAGDDFVSVAFTPSVANGSTINHYTVTPYAGAVAGTPVTGTVSPIVVTGLNNGVTYTFQTSAVDLVAGASSIATSNAVTYTISPKTTYTAVSSGDINAAITWSPYISVDLPQEYDVNIWSTDAFSLKAGAAAIVGPPAVPAVTAVTFHGAILNIPTGGTLTSGGPSVILTLNNLTLNGGKVLAANNLSMNLDLQNKNLTLNSGSLVTYSSLPDYIIFKNATLVGNGNITIAQMASNTNYAAYGYVEFQSSVSTSGFKGTFTVAPGNYTANPVSPAVNNGMGGTLKISAPTSGTFGISIPAANSAGILLPNGTTYASTLNGKLYFTPASGTLTLSSLILGGVEVAPGTYGLTTGTGITAFTATQLGYLDSRSTGKVVVLESVKPPTAVVASVGNTQASVTFSAPIVTSGSPILDYTATAYNDGLLVSSITGTSSPLVLTGLTNGVNYSYYVASRSIAGNSAPALATVPNLVPIKLATPTLVAPTNITASGFTANWATVTNATGYVISTYLNNYLFKTDSTAGKTSTNYSFNGNSIGYSYTYKVIAKGDGVRYSNSNLSAASAPIKTVTNMIVLPKILNNNMVLQQDMLAALWGWGVANDNITITASWGATAIVKVAADGKWSTKIQTPKAIPGQAPVYTLTFAGANNAVMLSNILIGDVWLCSGQSNMCLGLGAATNGAAEVAAANYPTMRLIQMGDDMNPNVQNNSISGAWSVCTPSSAQGFTAVGYFFGRELVTDPTINIPIGIIRSAVGGSNCEAWVRNETLIADPLLKSTFVDPYVANPNSYISDQQKPSWLYNGMIAPIIPLSIKGTVWYQGEGNANKYSTYKQLWGAMIQDWRSLGSVGDFPFYYVQLPNFTTTETWAQMREAQTTLLTLKNVGMAVTLDVGDLSNIHPINKYPVGKRLALWAKAKTYGQSIVYSGPIYKSCSTVNNTMIISFLSETIGGGLMSNDGVTIKSFQIAGADNVMYDATATISGNTIIVSSPSVSTPTKVWYAFSNTPVVNLTNAEGLPTCPFRTDVWDSRIGDILTPVSEIANKHGYLFKIQRKTISTPEIGAIQIYNLQGKRLLAARGVKELNTNLAKGIYIACFTSESGNSYSAKLIIGNE